MNVCLQQTNKQTDGTDFDPEMSDHLNVLLVYNFGDDKSLLLNTSVGGVAQLVARLTCDRWIPVSREFEPHQRLLLFPWARNFNLNA